MGRSELQTRKLEALRAWTSFIESGDEAAALVRPEILSSWARSGAAVSTDVREAPLADEGETAAIWRDSPLQVAVESGIADSISRAITRAVARPIGWVRSHVVDRSMTPSCRPVAGSCTGAAQQTQLCTIGA